MPKKVNKPRLYLIITTYFISDKLQAKTEASVAQNRESQRRSRARRKDFVQSLQQRLSDMERRGVEATLEMQQAALGVANENRLLRLLLSRHGVSENEINGFISSFGSQANAPISSSWLKENANIDNNCCFACPSRIRQNSINCTEQGSCFCTSTDASPEMNTVLRTPQPPAVPQVDETWPGSVPLPLFPSGVVSDSPITSAMASVDDTEIARRNQNEQNHIKSTVYRSGRTRDHGGVSNSQEILPQELHNAYPPYSPLCTATESRSPEAGPMEISCEEAAVIIASIRSDVEAPESVKQIRLELGCSDANHCVVKNMKVFQLIDASN